MTCTHNNDSEKKNDSGITLYSMEHPSLKESFWHDKPVSSFIFIYVSGQSQLEGHSNDKRNDSLWHDKPVSAYFSVHVGRNLHLKCR